MVWGRHSLLKIYFFLCMFDCRGVVPFAVYIDRVMPTIIAEIFEKMWSIIKF